MQLSVFTFRKFDVIKASYDNNKTGKIIKKNVMHDEDFFRTPESDIDAYAFSFVVQSLIPLECQYYSYYNVNN